MLLIIFIPIANDEEEKLRKQINLTKEVKDLYSIRKL